MSDRFEFADASTILDALSRGASTTKAWFDLRLQAERLSLVRGFERLLSLEELPIELYDHQRRAVFRVLREMRGRAVLADEVGLGKTVEAGVILREYRLRGLVRSVLILVPAILVEQWMAELEQKLHIPCRRITSPAHWEGAECAVVSLDRAKGGRHAPKALARPWDMVIVDEAHRLQNRASRNWEFVNALRKKYLLLLTATPVQNDLRELYNLITLLKPGQLLTYSDFKREFTQDRHSPRNVRRLRELLGEVMVRTARRDVALRFPRREVASWRVRVTREERMFHDELVDLLRRSYRTAPERSRNILPFLLLLRQASSHVAGAATSLVAMARRGTLPAITVADAERVAGRAEGVEPAKGGALLRLIETASDRHVVVFTHFRKTLIHLTRRLRERNQRVFPFHGGLDASERERTIADFRQLGGVLLCTETGSEGMNLQFCRWVINYDLPWNPLRLEQRIGRVHRLGQRRDVRIDNLAGEGTIETYILDLLERKIAMFDQVVGELEVILGDRQGDFELRIGEAVLSSESGEGLSERIEQLGDEIVAAKEAYQAQTRLIDRLFVPMMSGERGETDGTPERVCRERG